MNSYRCGGLIAAVFLGWLVSPCRGEEWNLGLSERSLDGSITCNKMLNAILPEGGLAPIATWDEAASDRFAYLMKFGPPVLAAEPNAGKKIGAFTLCAKASYLYSMAMSAKFGHHNQSAAQRYRDDSDRLYTQAVQALTAAGVRLAYPLP